MSAPASIKEELISRIEEISVEHAERLLDYLNMLCDPDELTAEQAEEVQRAMEEFERGETVSGEELKRELGIGV